MVWLWRGILGDGLEQNSRALSEMEYSGRWSGAEHAVMVVDDGAKYSGIVWREILGHELDRNTWRWWRGILGDGGMDYQGMVEWDARGWWSGLLGEGGVGC